MKRCRPVSPVRDTGAAVTRLRAARGATITREAYAIRIAILGALMGAVLVSGPVTSAAQEAPPDRPQCDRVYHVPEYRTLAKRVYRFTRVTPKPLYRLLHMRQCAVSHAALRAMQKITLRQRKARIDRRLRAERLCGTPPCNRRLGAYMAAKRGWTGEQWQCLDTLWGDRESGWRTDAHNASGAHGIPQALPGYKMGPGWESDARVQIRWGLGYIDGRYGTPCGALAHSYAYNWY